MPNIGIDWEDAFANFAYIEGAEDFPALWKQRAAAFRASAQSMSDLCYGNDPRESYDLFLPDGPAKGLAVFIHGGFWLAFGKSDWSHLAQGALDSGWAMAIPQYTLAPAIRIRDMTRQMGAAISAAAARITGPIHIAGHSAGGHLATRMVCDTSPLPIDLAQRVKRVVSISGVHDLRPLRAHSMNEKLNIDDSESQSESPVLQNPRKDVHVTAWVGAKERPEFLRQSGLLVETWGRKGAQTLLVVDKDRHHFDVIEGLENATHPLTRALLET